MRTPKDPAVLEPFIAPRTDAEYERTVEYLNKLVDEIGDNPRDPR